MQKCKRWIALILSVCVLISSVGINVQAQEKVRDTVMDVQDQKKISQVSPDEPETVSMEILPGKLNFIMQESDCVQTPGTQNIAASLGTTDTIVEQAKLHYKHRASGEEFTAEAVNTVENMVRFTMKYTDKTQAGVYELVSIAYQAGDQKYQVVFAELDMEISFGVDQETDTKPDEILVDQEVLEEVEANVVSMDGEGNVVSENSVADVLGDLQQDNGMRASWKAAAPQAANKVIVLDPGHDSTHAGARGNGCKEEEIVLKIAQYCKAELLKYSGVTVYMTRESNVCPYGGTSTDCNAGRVDFAAAKKANVYVSFHLNSSVSTSPHGVGVYYPNGSYRPDLGEEGKGLALQIYQNLSALGLATWAGGVLIHNSENNTLYPDGSLADYLSVIRRSKLAGFPAVLIEHAFLSNAGDVSGFLNTEEKIKNLGVADAKGIAAYYGLSIGGGSGNKPKIEWIQSRGSKSLRVRWEPVNNAVSYEVYRSTKKAGTYEKTAQLSDNTYNDKKLKAGTTYYYKVRAIYSNGKKSSFSSIHSAKTLAVPQITSIVSKSNGRLKITWKSVSKAKQYELLRSTKKNGSYQKVATISKKAGDTYIDLNLKTQKKYYYKLRARGGEKNGYSSYSAVSYGWAVKKTAITSVSSKSSTSLLLKWKKVDNAYAYRIQRSTSKKGTYTTVAEVKDGKTSYIDQNLKSKKNYYYRVQAMNRVNGKNGASGYCSPVAGKTISGTSITYVRSKSSGSMELKWKKDPDAFAYRIKRSLNKDSGYKKIAEVLGSNVTTYVDKETDAGKRYYYTVETIVKQNGVKAYSGDSKPKSAINLQKINITSTQAADGGITLNWEKISGANSYQIMRSASKDSGFEEIAKVNKAELTSFTDWDVSAGARYFYRVRALSDGTYTGYGSYCKTTEKWMLSAPKGLAVKTVSSSVTPDIPAQIMLSWNKVNGANSYVVLKSVEEQGSYEEVAAVNEGENLAYTDSAVQTGVTYYYKVAAVAKLGQESGRGDETVPVSGIISEAK